MGAATVTQGQRERENLHENCEADSEGGDARQWKVFTA